MNMSVTFYGEIVFYSMFIVGALSYYLGKRKTDNPKVVALIGVILCITPPLNIVYLIVLSIKNNVVKNKENEKQLESE